MRHSPGEVHFLPPDDMPGGDNSTRRHVLVSACLESSEAAALAFGSTKATEAGYGAAHVLLDPYATKYRQTGFDEPTYIYVSRLFSEDLDALGYPVGRVIQEMPAILQQASVALGIGTGTCDSGSAAGSLRGRLVQFDPVLTRTIDTSFGVIVSEPRYSLQQRYQNVVPILDEARFNANPGDVIVERRDWLTHLGGMSKAIFAVGDVFAVWHPSRISRPLPGVIDEAAMNAIDDALRAHFGL